MASDDPDKYRERLASLSGKVLETLPKLDSLLWEAKRCRDLSTVESAGDVRQLPPVISRVESGPIQFGDDWPGTFIRGDNAFGYRLAIDAVLELLRGQEGQELVAKAGVILQLYELDNLAKLLDGSNLNPGCRRK